MNLGMENTFYWSDELQMNVERGKEEEYRKKKIALAPPPTDKQLMAQKHAGELAKSSEEVRDTTLATGTMKEIAKSSDGIPNSTRTHHNNSNAATSSGIKPRVSGGRPLKGSATIKVEKPATTANTSSDSHDALSLSKPGQISPRATQFSSALHPSSNALSLSTASLSEQTTEEESDERDGSLSLSSPSLDASPPKSVGKYNKVA